MLVVPMVEVLQEFPPWGRKRGVLQDLARYWPVREFAGRRPLCCRDSVDLSTLLEVLAEAGDPRVPGWILPIPRDYPLQFLCILPPAALRVLRTSTRKVVQQEDRAEQDI